MSVAVEDAYPLGRSVVEAARLAEQNQVLIEIAGFTIHREIRQRLPPSEARITELATGTGACLCTLAGELPADTQLDGFDISDAAFPHTSALPTNVSLSTLDATALPPAKLHERYDAVFIRFMNIAMTPPDWGKVCRAAHLMLKPGGALQWYEGAFRQLRFPLYSHPGASTTALTEGFRFWFDSMTQLEWVFENLPGALKDVGFQNIIECVTSNDRDAGMRAVCSRLWIGACKSGLQMRMKAGAKPAPASDTLLDDLVARMLREVEGGGYLRFNVHIWVAVKPGS